MKRRIKMDCLNCKTTLPGAKIELDPDGCCVKCGKFVKEKSLIHKDTEKLASDHWDYIAEVILAHTGLSADDREYIICKHHYISAFIHGFKHGITYKQEKSKFDH
jgi:hypothetical protein